MGARAIIPTGAAGEGARRVAGFARGLTAHLSLATQFLVASLVVLLIGALVVGTWVGQQVEASVINQTASLTGLYVDSVITPYLQPLAQQPTLPAAQIAALDQLFATRPLGDQVVAIKVWSVDGTILYCPDSRLIGRHFGVDAGLGGAVRGWVTADMTDLNEPENVFERQRWSRLLEVYIPVREQGGGRVIAVTEFYQLPDDVDRRIVGAREQSWGLVAAVFLVT
jgi:hypothetical protein